MGLRSRYLPPPPAADISRAAVEESSCRGLRCGAGERNRTGWPADGCLWVRWGRKLFFAFHLLSIASCPTDFESF